MSVTTVPIQPIKKGSIPKFWFGIAALALAGGALAWWGTGDIRSEYQTNEQFLSDNADAEGVTVTASGLQIKTIRGGEGKPPSDADVAIMNLKGTLRDGTVFQPETRGPLPVAGSIPGFSEALKMMQKGGKYQIWIPSKIGYGSQDIPDPRTGGIAIPGDSLLIFEVELQDYLPREAFEAEMQKQQAAMQQVNEAMGQGSPPPQIDQ
jgi:FKBP-type peptidyl-prolyl cis-trans isomerase FkpA